MKFTASAASVVYAGDETHWSQTYTTPSLFIAAYTVGEKSGSRGNAFLKALENGTSEITTSSLETFKHFLESTGKDASISYAGALLKNNILYAVCDGGIMWVRRGNKLVSLLVGTGTLSGIVNSGDIFFLACESFLKAVDQSDIETALKDNDNPQEIAETLVPQLHKKDTHEVAGAVILRIIEGSPQLVVITPIETVTRIKLFLQKFVKKFQKPTLRVKPLGVVIVILLLLLVGGIVLGISTQTQKKQTQAGQEVLDAASHKYEEGIALVDLNPIRARELLRDAQTLLKQEETKTHTKEISEKLAEKLQKVNQGISFALRSYDINPASFFQLDLIKPQAYGTTMSLYQNVLAILDHKNKALYTLTIDSKASRIVAGGDNLSSANSVAVYSEEIYVFDSAVRKVIPNSGDFRTVIDADSAWGSIAKLAAYAGNLYLLDPGKNQIWKYFGAEIGFGSRQDYFLFDTQVDLTGVGEMAIDGTVWLPRGSQVLHFVQGKEEVWQIQGLDTPLGTTLDIYTDDITKNLYVYDRANKRVVVVDKDGVYLAQYRFSQDLPVSDFVVSESIKKILLLAGGTIYGIDLK